MTTLNDALGIPELANLRITRVWFDDVLIVDDAQGQHIGGFGEQFGIDMANPPPCYCFEVQLFPVHAVSAPKLFEVES